MSNIQLHHGDCLELLKDVPDNSVHFICCDLPYTTTEYEWDSDVDLTLLWEQYKRVITSNGVIALFGSEPFSTRLRMSNMKWFKYDWIWKKNTCTGFVHSKNMPMKDYEIISIFSGGQWDTRIC